MCAGFTDHQHGEHPCDVGHGRRRANATGPQAAETVGDHLRADRMVNGRCGGAAQEGDEDPARDLCLPTADRMPLATATSMAKQSSGSRRGPAPATERAPTRRSVDDAERGYRGGTPFWRESHFWVRFLVTGGGCGAATQRIPAPVALRNFPRSSGRTSRPWCGRAESARIRQPSAAGPLGGPGSNLRSGCSGLSCCRYRT